MTGPLLDLAAAPAQAPLFVVAGRGVDAATLLDEARALADALPADVRYLANLCDCRYRFTLGLLAGLLRGAPCLLPANRQAGTLERLLEDYHGVLFLHDEGLEDEVALLRRRRAACLDITVPPCAAGAGSAGAGSVRPGSTPEIDPEQTAAVVFTSGSTGDPVPITKAWGTLAGTAALLRRRFPLLAAGASIVATVPAQHMYGLETTVMTALQGGCSVSAGRPFFPADVAAALQRASAPRVLVTTPVHLRSLLRAGEALPALQMVLSATAPLDEQLAAQAERRWQCPVLEIYGCSEAGSMATRQTTADPGWRWLDGFELRQRAGGHAVSAPHLGAPVPLQDRLETLAEGGFRLLGRGADMVNIAGKRASLASLSAQLRALDGVADGIFFLRGDAAAGQERLAALVVSQRRASEITAELARVMDPVFLPRPLKKVGAIPRNPLGKTTRALLLRALAAGD